jgi:hypothetical protein
VLETLSSRCEQRLNELGLTQLTQEAEGVAADVFVGVLKVHADTVAVQRVSINLFSIVPQCFLPNQNHLLLQLAIRVQLRAHLVVHIQQLLQWLAL